MASTSKMQYTAIQVTGPVSVEPAERIQRSWWRVLIMGSTGSGKSTFIEALGLKGSSKISSNGLDGYTQAVSTYKLNHITTPGGRQIYVIDSPGFADTKISELAIVSMLQRWIKNNGFVNHIFYLMPITKVRLPGSQRKVLKTFRALTGITTARNITVITTMWDTIWGEHAAQRAEETFRQLQNNIWKDFINQGSQIARFQNTKESALSILDQVFGSTNNNSFTMEEHRERIRGSPYELNLLTDLQDRIQNLCSHIPTLRDELAQAEALGDELLKLLLLPKLQEAEADLARFQAELDEFMRLPAPPPAVPDGALSSFDVPSPRSNISSIALRFQDRPRRLFSRSIDSTKNREKLIGKGLDV
ncbi:hypothetical protein BJ165DRAFT_1534075 [Panaeolus papilionaceus]|nr:hypothetical protein BJ165DRAFT_1534075 [Panaeolus papilionaceus]